MKSKIAVVCMLLALAVLLASCLTEIEEKVTVTFDGNGGTPVPATRELTKGNRLGSVDTPVKGTEYFLGWYDGFRLYDSNTEVYADITLIAKWKTVEMPDTVIVTFSATGAVPASTMVEVVVGKALGPLFPVDPRRQGRWFMGWEVNGVPFDKTSVVTEPVTVTPKWDYKQQFTVTLQVPEAHREANPGVNGTQFTVYDGDSIDEWVKQFPADMDKAPDPNPDQYHQFFRWSEGGLANGVIYTERSPIEKNVILGAVYGLYFHKKQFDIDLTTINSRVSMNEYRVIDPDYHDGEGYDFGARYPMTNAEDVIPVPVRSPLPDNVVVNADGTVTFTVQAQPTLMYFRPTVELWKLMKQSLVENDTKVSFWLNYEFADPTQEDDDNKLNIFFGNLMNNDNWNSTEVRDLTWKDIVLGEESNGERNGSELHKLAATIINFDQNVDWIIFRMGRVDTKVPFRMTIKEFKITVEQ